MGGAGADTAKFTGLVSAGYVDVSGSGASLISAAANVSGSTLLGGSGHDTIDLTGSGVTNARIIAGAGNDIIDFDMYTTGASIVGGTGNDSIDFNFTSANAEASTNASGAATNTYFFGASGGQDTINFVNASTNIGTVAMTIAVDSSFGLGATSITFDSSTSLITIETGNSIFVNGITGASSSGSGALFAWLYDHHCQLLRDH